MPMQYDEDFDKAPTGWTLAWHSGWPAIQFDQDRVRLGNVTVPSKFHLLIRPPVEVAGPDTLIVLCYKAAAGEVLLTMVAAFGLEVPTAITLVRKQASLEWWKRWVFLHMVFDVGDEGGQLMGGEGGQLDASRNDVWGTPSGQMLLDAFNTPIARRRNRLTESHLTKVADVYRAACRDGLPPTKAVAQNFSASHSTAARWVGAARKAGHLGPADGSRGGERPQTKQSTKGEKS